MKYFNIIIDIYIIAYKRWQEYISIYDDNEPACKYFGWGDNEK